MKKVINGYEILEQLGQGMTGVVYKTRNVTDNKFYAVKKLWTRFTEREYALKWFLHDCSVHRYYNHRNIVRSIDYFHYESDYYIVMEYIQCTTLKAIINVNKGPLSVSFAFSLYKQILEGIAYIHSHYAPSVHCYITPANILISKDGTAKITDIGIAKTHDSGLFDITGADQTSVYLSPEQNDDLPGWYNDFRTDVYSLGIILFEMLCGQTPFQLDRLKKPWDILNQLKNYEIPPPTKFSPDIPEILVDFVMKAVHKDKNRRYADAKEMLKEWDKVEQVIHTIDEDEHDLNKVISNDKFFETNQIANSRLFEKVSLANAPHHLTGKEMVFVEGGSFIMGVVPGSEEPDGGSLVTLSSFYIAKVPVTQKLWMDVMWDNPAHYKGGRRPVECVSWHDAIEFCNALSRMEGLHECYTGIEEEKAVYKNTQYRVNPNLVVCDFTANGYRLPTEAEWEYAARGGNKSGGYLYSGSNNLDEVGWYYDNMFDGTHYVGSKRPNELGIFDMTGNIDEWCWDWFEERRTGSKSNPKGPESGSERVIRGGNFICSTESCRVVLRACSVPFSRTIRNFGFRLARTK